MSLVYTIRFWSTAGHGFEGLDVATGEAKAVRSALHVVIACEGMLYRHARQVTYQ